MNPPHRYYQDLYQNTSEPWSYKGRAAEVLRHQTIVRSLIEIQAGFDRVLDIGCSLGQLTCELSLVSRNLFAIDVSEVAVQKARAAIQREINSDNVPLKFSNHKEGQKSFFLVAGLPGLPFQSEQFDLVVAADAINEFLKGKEKERAVQVIFSLLRKGGYSLFTDYLRPELFPDFLDLIIRHHFRIVKLVPLHDRVWYQFESWFKRIRHWLWVKKILSSLILARCLRVPAMLYGRHGSMHILILAQKIPESQR